MCGIAGGMSSTLNTGELNKIKGLMMMSCFRGMFGSGSMVVVPEKKVLRILTHKTELCAAELTCDEDFLFAINKSPKIVVSHARAPTKGNNELENVHPHRSKHITGVHNGTMHRVMDKVVGTEESDSAAVFAAIAEHGVSEFIKESRGAYSLVWLDAKEGSLNFLRNDQRPMVFASAGWQDNVQTMYWSSELGQLHYVLQREGSKLTDFKFESPKPWQHIRFAMDVAHRILPLELKQYDDPIVKTTTGYTGYYGDGWDFGEYTDSQNVTPLAQRIIENRQKNTHDFRRNDNRTQHRLPMVINRPIPKVEDILSGRVRSSTFHPSDDARHKTLLRSGPCCLCDNTPSVVTREGTTIYPRVHEVKFGVGFPQYICDDCVQAGNPIALGVLELDPISATKH